MSQPDIFFASLWVFPTVWLFWLSCLATSSLCIGFVKNMSAGCALGLVGLARVTWSHYHCWLRWFSPSFCGLFLCYHYDWSGFHLLTHAWVFTDLTGCFLNLKKKIWLGFHRSLLESSLMIAWIIIIDCCVGSRYRCIVPYPPQTEHELELEIGDIVHVHKRREDGWYKGTQERTSKTGLFPGSFVEKCDWKPLCFFLCACVCQRIKGLCEETGCVSLSTFTC